MPATPVWLAAAETLFNRGIQASPAAVALAHRLDSTVLRVDIEGMMSIHASVMRGRLGLIAVDREVARGGPHGAGTGGTAASGVAGAASGAAGGGVAGAASGAATVGAGGGAGTDTANARISGSAPALFDLARGVPRGRGRAAARVSGDAEIASLYRELFTLARPDPEEEVALVVGDMPARQLSRLARQTMGWLRKARRTAGDNVVEYLQEESRDLVNKTELEEFLRGVDELRETAARVEARLAGLERRFKGSA